MLYAKDLLKHLTAHAEHYRGPWTAAGVASHYAATTGQYVSKQAAKRHLHALADTGAVEEVGAGLYRLAQPGPTEPARAVPGTASLQRQRELERSIVAEIRTYGPLPLSKLNVRLHRLRPTHAALDAATAALCGREELLRGLDGRFELPRVARG